MESDDPDWFLQEWATFRGKKQADLVNELGWAKNTAHKVWHSKQPYRRDLVNELAKWLQIRPFEMLMRPSEAMSLRRLRETAALIVADNEAPPFEPAPRAPLRRKRSGTHG